MICNFQNGVCVTCGRIQKTDYAACPQSTRATRREQCKHLGPQIAEAVCQSCGDNVLRPIFACAVHGQAAFRKKLGPSVAVCKTCRDYSERRGDLAPGVSPSPGAPPP